MNKKLFRLIYTISNWFYVLYFKVLAKILIRKLLKMTIVERRNFLLSRGFLMIEYDEIGKSQKRVYRHKSGMKITDKNTTYVLTSNNP